MNTGQLNLLIAASIASQSSTVKPDLTSEHLWEGWGTSLCWMGKAFGDRNDVADLLFTTKTVKIAGGSLPGLGLNIVRYNAGACSWNEIDGRKMVVSKTIQPFRQMEGFWLDGKNLDPSSDSWDWSVDANQRSMLQKAKRRGADKFELFSNSPMWWMCKNDNPSGGADPLLDNLRDDHYENFVHYLAAVARRAKDRWGIRFTSIAPFNEPASRWWDANCKQEGCHFSPIAQTKLLPLLRQSLDRQNLKDLPIAASDETYVSHALSTWNAFDTETRKIVGQINVHGYEGDKSPRRLLREAIGDRRLWLSEHGENDLTGLSMARAIHLDLHNLRPTAWCYWQPLDGSGWGLLESDVPNAKILHANSKHFVLAHYTRHIRPGMSILVSGDESTIAAFDPKRRKLVFVTANGSVEATKTLDLTNFSKAEGPVAHWITEPKGQTRYTKLAGRSLKGKKLTVVLPPDSVQTFEVSGVDTGSQSKR